MAKRLSIPKGFETLHHLYPSLATMFKFSVLLATVLAAASTASAASINTPTALVQCQPVLLQWSDAQGTVYVSVLPGKQVSAAPLVSFSPQSAGTDSIKWVPNLPAGTDVTLSISDSTGKVAYSGTVTVRAGTDTSSSTGSASTASQSSSSSGKTSGASSFRADTAAMVSSGLAVAAAAVAYFA
ncbi:hypothetical protein [Sporisorium scitamineum]|uniref:Uncharacterized protein n=1 Tax=Sporisorium scitamineum TaxID=49012 RepID=A0A0F7S1F8_9BASI|nr:hypothetical protein [Sporisorium scitamineum]